MRCARSPNGAKDGLSYRARPRPRPQKEKPKNYLLSRRWMQAQATVENRVFDAVVDEHQTRRRSIAWSRVNHVIEKMEPAQQEQPVVVDVTSVYDGPLCGFAWYRDALHYFVQHEDHGRAARPPAL